VKFKDTPEYQECILAFDLVVGLKHCRAFEKAGRMSPDTPCYRSNESTSIKAPVNIVENYGELLNQLDSNGFILETLDERCYVYNEIIIYFVLPLLLKTHFLGESSFTRRLGFLTRDQVEERYLDQEIPFLSITYELAVEMEFVKRCEVTFESDEEESDNLHPDVGSQYSLTLSYSECLHVSELEDELLNDRINIPHRDNSNDLFTYRMSKIQLLPPGTVTTVF
jgi:hypothetical protein